MVLQEGTLPGYGRTDNSTGNQARPAAYETSDKRQAAVVPLLSLAVGHHCMATRHVCLLVRVFLDHQDGAQQFSISLLHLTRDSSSEAIKRMSAALLTCLVPHRYLWQARTRSELVSSCSTTASVVNVIQFDNGPLRKSESLRFSLASSLWRLIFKSSASVECRVRQRAVSNTSHLRDKSPWHRDLPIIADL
jgi:hypothetical protein